MSLVRRLILAFVAACLVLPIVLLAVGWAKPGVILWGFGAALLGLNVLRFVAREQALRQEQSLWDQRSNGARTIYVELFDANGGRLTKSEADRRLAEAYAKAGPRDTVIPLTKPLPRDEDRSARS